MLSRVLRSSWAPPTFTGLVVLAILLRTGMVPWDLARFAAYLTVVVAPPGIFAWRFLLQKFHTAEGNTLTWLEDVSLGTIFGFGLQLPVYIVGLLVGVPLLVLILPVSVLIVSLTPFGRRIWSLPTGHFDWRGSWVLSGVMIYGMVWLAHDAFALRPMRLAPNLTPSVDETFHQALIADLSHRFPPQIPFMLGTPLDYHWFVHAQLAATRWVTGIDSVVLLRQLMPTLMLALTITGLASVAFRLTRRASAAVVAPMILVVGGYDLFGWNYNPGTFSEAFLSDHFVGSPSQSYGVMMSLPAVLLILEVLRPNAKNHKMTWVALVLSLLALSGSKATFMPIFFCGSLALWVFLLVLNRRIDRTVTALAALFFAVTLFAQFVLFGGQSGSMALEPGNSVVQALKSQGIALTDAAAVAMALAMLTGWLLYGVGSVGLLRKGRWRDPRVIWMAAAVSAGIIVPFLFFRSGLSQYWFQRSVAELVVLLSVWGLAVLLPRPLTRRKALTLAEWAAGSGLAAFLASIAIQRVTGNAGNSTLLTLTLTVLAPIALVIGYVVIRYVRIRHGRRAPELLLIVTILLGLGLTNVYTLAVKVVTQEGRVSREFPELFAPGGVEAAEYIRDASPTDAVVATNMHCSSPDTPICDNRHFWVSAYTERRVVIEGWGYTAETNSDAIPGQINQNIPAPDPERLAINDAAFQYPSEETVGRLIDDYGVDWLLVSRAYPADIKGLNSLPTLIQRRFQNNHYVVYQVVE